MSIAKGTISAGVCGFVTEVTATCEDSQNVSFTVASTCEKIKALGAALPTVDACAEIGDGFEGQLLSTARSVLGGCCAGCVVPSGIFKVMQVSAKLALPAPIGIQIERG